MDAFALRAKLAERDQIVAEANKQLRQHGIEFILTSLKGVFAKYPELKEFSWTQGQFYNDENYYYDVRYDNWYLRINDERVEEVEAQKTVEGEEVTPWQETCADDIRAVLQTLKDEDFRTMFGENIVTVTKDEITFESFYD
jgi:hypothetical protein